MLGPRESNGDIGVISSITVSERHDSNVFGVPRFLVHRTTSSQTLSQQRHHRLRLNSTGVMFQGAFEQGWA